MGKKYIHYGNDHFDIEKFHERCDAIRSRSGNVSCYDKPIGFWASPVDAEYGWKDWCEGIDFHTERLDASFTFELHPYARVLEVRSFDDVADYVCEDPHFPERCCWDFDKLYRDFDAVELFLSENWTLRDIHMFYCWDVDSIVIWNPEVIVDNNAKRILEMIKNYAPTEISLTNLMLAYYSTKARMTTTTWLFKLLGGYLRLEAEHRRHKEKIAYRYRSNNWLKRHGVPMRRKAGRY